MVTPPRRVKMRKEDLLLILSALWWWNCDSLLTPFVFMYHFLIVVKPIWHDFVDVHWIPHQRGRMKTILDLAHLESAVVIAILKVRLPGLSLRCMLQLARKFCITDTELTGWPWRPRDTPILIPMHNRHHLKKLNPEGPAKLWIELMIISSK